MPRIEEWIMAVVRDEGRRFDLTMPVVVIGAGGCGLTAAIAVRDAGIEVLVLERDVTPLGSTGMSTGLIPAAGTPEQAVAGVNDDGVRFAADIVAKAGKTDVVIVRRIADESADTIALLQKHGLSLTLVDGFIYPGHSVRRMFGTPNRIGSELIAGLQRAAEDMGASILCEAAVETLFVNDVRRITGVAFRRPDGAVEEVGCEALILACCGFGGNAEMVRAWMPEMDDAPYHGHPGNRGDAVRWGVELDAAVADMAAYQGHGNLAAGRGIIVNWPSVIMGGFQLNLSGERFYDESIGYSAAAAQVHAQPHHLAWTIFDARIEETMVQFEEYHDAVRSGAILIADTIEALAAATRLPEATLAAALTATSGYASGTARDAFGRDFTGAPPLTAPYRAVRVTGALLHTQGGLTIDVDARVMGQDGVPLPNLFAGGGAARGISGPGAAGYIAGNGLLTATTLGKLAGRAAVKLIAG
jgi:fumarate reductase flavoprotein subunit